ncbi:EAP30 family protein [Rozella allomycis CSF55]|uniref:Vacuolar-sorting protein SNF8 n=1 Tax=Rozella allomycis (strain CSF55) TaxID=988480 RepID=A0A4P9YMS5_ROZAC|nr:EAP30 family protein [Rozella allomycis CSF55]
MRRGVGIAGLQRQQQIQDQFREKGDEIMASSLQQVERQLQTFKANLEEFAKKHNHEIKKDPVFRAQFHKMCSALGVDPLSSSKGFWSELLGFGDFYYEIAIQLIELCIKERGKTGGLLDLEEVLKQFAKIRKSSQSISEDDIQRALNTLKPLGCAYSIVEIGKRKMIKCIPKELNQDTLLILIHVEESQQCTFSKQDIINKLKWSSNRIDLAVDSLLSQGMIWIDDQHDPNYTLYWIPSLWIKLTQ